MCRNPARKNYGIHYQGPDPCRSRFYIENRSLTPQASDTFASVSKRGFLRTDKARDRASLSSPGPPILPTIQTKTPAC